MINANELMIGNYVNFDEDSTIFKVTEISEKGIGVSNDEEDTWIETYQFSPIPLTVEWLEKFGFDYDASYPVPKVEKNKLILFGYENEFSANFGHVHELDVHVTTVHQLQNLYFALIGEELTVEK